MQKHPDTQGLPLKIDIPAQWVLSIIFSKAKVVAATCAIIAPCLEMI